VVKKKEECFFRGPWDPPFVQAKFDLDSASAFQPSMQFLHAVHTQIVAAF